jgi:preprotein translocase subunit Sss1
MSSEGGAEAHDEHLDGRTETPVQRADRNWIEVLQELRVLQTGTQILTGFLLALAFQPAFAGLTSGQRALYLVLVVLAAVSTIVALAPVALHRAVFRRRVKPRVVEYGHIALLTSLVTVSLLLVGVVAFVFDVVVDIGAAWGAIAGLAALILVVWIVVPLVVRARRPDEEGP